MLSQAGMPAREANRYGEPANRSPDELRITRPGPGRAVMAGAVRRPLVNTDDLPGAEFNMR